MNSIRALISYAVNLGWTLEQLDVSNPFLHVGLQEEVHMEIPQEEVYMEIPLDFYLKWQKGDYANLRKLYMP